MSQSSIGDLDLHRFEELCDGERGTGRGDAAVAAPILRAALELWRGPGMRFAYEPLHRLKSDGSRSYA